MNPKLLALVVALAAAGMLASCETMSAEECAAADWGALGFSDASRNGSDNFANRAESCANKGFSADASAYREGFAGGMRAFCTPERGFAFARAGGSFNGACPADLAEGFSYGYSDGRRIYAAQAEIDAARGKISNAESRRRQIDEDLRDREHALEEATTDEQREHLRDQISQLRRERRDVNEDLRIAQEQMPYLLRLMDDLRYEIGNRWGPW